MEGAQLDAGGHVVVKGGIIAGAFAKAAGTVSAREAAILFAVLVLVAFEGVKWWLNRRVAKSAPSVASGVPSLESVAPVPSPSVDDPERRRFLARVDNFPQAKDILKAASLASMTLPTSANPNYAKGWEVNVFNNWWHSGSLPGTTTFMARISSNFCWAALTNSRVPGSNMNLELDQLMWTIASVPASWGL